MKLVAPIVHLNGSSRSMLDREYRDAAEAIRNADEAIRRIETHDRSYYIHPDGPQTGMVARQQRSKWIRILQRINEELLAIHIAFMDGKPHTNELEPFPAGDDK